MNRPFPPNPRFAPAPLAALVLVLAGLAPAAARAATAVPLDLPALAARADLVVRGVVRSSAARLEPSGRIVTDVRVVVDEALRGVADEEVWVTTPGGEVGDEGQKVPGAPELAPGDEVVLFLYRPGPATRLAWTAVVGLAQGVLRVDRGTGGRPRLSRDLSGLRLPGPDAEDLPDTMEGLRDALRALPPRGVAP